MRYYTWGNELYALDDKHNLFWNDREKWKPIPEATPLQVLVTKGPNIFPRGKHRIKICLWKHFKSLTAIIDGYGGLIGGSILVICLGMVIAAASIGVGKWIWSTQPNFPTPTSIKVSYNGTIMEYQVSNVKPNIIERQQ